MRRIAPTAVPALCLALATPAPASGPATPLRHDPFRKPEIMAAGAPRAAGDAGAAGAVWEGVLRAVLVAGGRSLANVDGVIVGLGEEIDGYRLTGVGEREAVFERDGKPHVLNLDGESQGAN